LGTDTANTAVLDPRRPDSALHGSHVLLSRGENAKTLDGSWHTAMRLAERPSLNTGFSRIASPPTRP
jgi:hypothetical protein